MTERLQEIARSLGISDYDLLLIGDGSGNLVNAPAGWFCTLFDSKSEAIVDHFGGVNGGTNNYAELAPYCHALWSYHSQRKDNIGGIVKVAIISDSEVTVRCGNGEYARKANASIWAQIEWFERNHYRLHWVHVPRNSNAFSEFADHIAGVVRRSISQIVVADEKNRFF